MGLGRRLGNPGSPWCRPAAVRGFRAESKVESNLIILLEKSAACGQSEWDKTLSAAESLSAKRDSTP
jgi:hypothetical protein